VPWRILHILSTDCGSSKNTRGRRTNYSEKSCWSTTLKRKLTWKCWWRKRIRIPRSSRLFQGTWLSWWTWSSTTERTSTKHLRTFTSTFLSNRWKSRKKNGCISFGFWKRRLSSKIKWASSRNRRCSKLCWVTLTWPSPTSTSSSRSSKSSNCVSTSRSKSTTRRSSTTPRVCAGYLTSVLLSLAALRSSMPSGTSSSVMFSRNCTTTCTRLTRSW